MSPDYRPALVASCALTQARRESRAKEMTMSEEKQTEAQRRMSGCAELIEQAADAGQQGRMKVAAAMMDELVREARETRDALRKEGR